MSGNILEINLMGQLHLFMWQLKEKCIPSKSIGMILDMFERRDTELHVSQCARELMCTEKSGHGIPLNGGSRNEETTVYG